MEFAALLRAPVLSPGLTRLGARYSQNTIFGDKDGYQTLQLLGGSAAPGAETPTSLCTHSQIVRLSGYLAEASWKTCWCSLGPEEDPWSAAARAGACATLYLRGEHPDRGVRRPGDAYRPTSTRTRASAPTGKRDLLARVGTTDLPFPQRSGSGRPTFKEYAERKNAEAVAEERRRPEPSRAAPGSRWHGVLRAGAPPPPSNN